MPNSFAHMTYRDQDRDGKWRLYCNCGHVSAPRDHRDELGWQCPVEHEENPHDDTDRDPAGRASAQARR